MIFSKNKQGKLLESFLVVQVLDGMSEAVMPTYTEDVTTEIYPQHEKVSPQTHRPIWASTSKNPLARGQQANANAMPTNGVGVGVLLLIAHVTSTVNSWWPTGVGVLIAHVTSTLNSWWPTGVGVLFIAHIQFNSQLLMTSGGRGPPPDCSYYFNSQLLMTSGGGGVGGPPHCSYHFNSQLVMTSRGWRVGGPFSSLLMSLQLSTPDDQRGEVG